MTDERPARTADQAGTVERDGVTIAYQVYGDDGPTVVLLPTWSIVPSASGRPRCLTWPGISGSSPSTAGAPGAPTGPSVRRPTPTAEYRRGRPGRPGRAPVPRPACWSDSPRGARGPCRPRPTSPAGSRGARPRGDPPGDRRRDAHAPRPGARRRRGALLVQRTWERGTGAKAFAALEPTGRIQTLVCVDAGRRDADGDLIRPIADKELAVLLGEIAAKGPHVVALLDCCHSGTGTRDAGARIRQWLPDPDERATRQPRRHSRARVCPPDGRLPARRP